MIGCSKNILLCSSKGSNHLKKEEQIMKDFHKAVQNKKGFYKTPGGGHHFMKLFHKKYFF